MGGKIKVFEFKGGPSCFNNHDKITDRLWFALSYYDLLYVHINLPEYCAFFRGTVCSLISNSH